jgi:hypothetical protein
MNQRDSLPQRGVEHELTGTDRDPPFFAILEAERHPVTFRTR